MSVEDIGSHDSGGVDRLYWSSISAGVASGDEKGWSPDTAPFAGRGVDEVRGNLSPGVGQCGGGSGGSAGIPSVGNEEDLPSDLGLWFGKEPQPCPSSDSSPLGSPEERRESWGTPGGDLSAGDGGGGRAAVASDDGDDQIEGEIVGRWEGLMADAAVFVESVSRMSVSCLGEGEASGGSGSSGGGAGSGTRVAASDGLAREGGDTSVSEQGSSGGRWLSLPLATSRSSSLTAAVVADPCGLRHEEDHSPSSSSSSSTQGAPTDDSSGRELMGLPLGSQRSPVHPSSRRSRTSSSDVDGRGEDQSNESYSIGLPLAGPGPRPVPCPLPPRCGGPGFEVDRFSATPEDGLMPRPQDSGGAVLKPSPLPLGTEKRASSCKGRLEEYQQRRVKEDGQGLGGGQGTGCARDHGGEDKPPQPSPGTGSRRRGAGGAGGKGGEFPSAIGRGRGAAGRSISSRRKVSGSCNRSATTGIRERPRALGKAAARGGGGREGDAAPRAVRGLRSTHFAPGYVGVAWPDPLDDGSGSAEPGARILVKLEEAAARKLAELDERARRARHEAAERQRRRSVAYAPGGKTTHPRSTRPGAHGRFSRLSLYSRVPRGLCSPLGKSTTRARGSWVRPSSPPCSLPGDPGTPA